MTYTSHGLMTPADLEEYRRDCDWGEVDQPETDDAFCPGPAVGTRVVSA